ncbi:MFS transporter [Agromyces aerolatus]|uniref:MFS transporter n=1 Tax=Agromyces sp. LY-1074 TaxID=3074080 RepID=UPI00285B627F|nr:MULTISPECIES: MFS transporter [unclassified Agromyces]MDR5699043.1 MFS transporter [Agromyces sp. LY-1074]MDR5705179.1 MFS transporter [Agromyces sp. LY-1358]
MSAPSQPPFSWRSVVLPAYLPTLVFSLGEGAMIPVIPLVAADRGASLAVAGLVAAMLMVGELVADLPAGWLVARIGERPAMIGAAMLAVIAVLVPLGLPSVFALGVGVFLLGLATAVFGLARHAFLTTYVPARVRARALSTLGGVFRGGWAIGPFVAAGIIAWTGSSEAVFWVLVVACFAVVAVLLLLPDPEKTFGAARVARGASGEVRTAGEAEAEAESASVFHAIRTHAGVLARIGTGAGLLSALRASRTVILPLWSVSIGMPAEQAALVIGVSGALDFALFYVSGQIMDRYGRLWSAIPGLLGMAAGHIALAFTHELPDRVAWFTGLAIFLGVANGVTSGIIMTLGADLAPKRNPAPFLGAFRTIADAGQAGAPLLISAVTSIVSIMAASAVVGGLGIVGAVMLWRWVPRYVPHVRRGRQESPPEGDD